MNKLWVKILVVFCGGGIVWALSFLSSIKPELAMILSSANSAIVGITAFVTGWQPKTS
jgi:hypothetical protein